MSDLKTKPGEFLETREALAEYVESMFRPAHQMNQAMVAQTPQATEIENGDAGNLQVLRVQVDKQVLAIPVVQIKSVIGLADQNQILPSGVLGPWLGTVSREGRKVPLYDLGWILAFQNSNAENPPGASVSHRSNAVILRGQQFALACDHIGEIVEISKDKVRLSRDQRPSRRWMEGIVTDGMVPIVNIPVIKEIFRSHGTET